MKSKTEYIVYRHGSNAANQGMTPVMIIGIWEAATRQGAIDKAAEEVVVYNNQHLTATPVSRASRADYYVAVETDAVRNGLGD